jgi:4-amino-4-deoxy-L-arabinose transferase-like glycosyltransferase
VNDGGNEGSPRSRWRDRRAGLRWLAPTSLALLFLYGLAWEIRLRRGVLFDERLFISVGQGVLSHGYPWEGFRVPAGMPFFDHTPLFSYLMAIPASLVGPFGFDAALVAARAVSAVFGLATVLATYALAREARGTVSGLVAGALVATNAYFIHLSWVVHMEVPMSFALVVGVWLLLRERWWWAGVAVAASVLLKEIALAFWLAAAIYALARRGWRAAAKVTLPSGASFLAVVVGAWMIDRHQFGVVLDRWLNSAGGTNTVSWRFRVSAGRWLRTIAVDTVGTTLTGITAIALIVGAVRRARVPSIVVVPLAYCAFTIVATFLIHLKEERWLTAVIPMSALATGLLVDWGAAARRLALLDRHHPPGSR